MAKTNETKIEAPRGEIVYLPITALAPHPENVRKNVGDVSELAESIRQNGVLQNLTVVPVGGEWQVAPGVEYFVVIGNRRLAAAKEAGLEELPCVIADMTREEQIKTMLLENIQRSDLTPIEQADGFQLLLDFGGTLSSIAADTGFSESTVRRRLRMKEVADKIGKKNFEGRQISFEDLDRLWKIEDEKKRAEVAKELGTNNFGWKFDQAFGEQEKRKHIARWKEFLKASELKPLKGWSPDYESVGRCGVDAPCKTLDKLLGDIPASECVYDSDIQYGIYIRRKKTEKVERKETPEQRAAREKKEARDAKKALLREAEERAFRLRRDFVKSVSEKTAKEHLEDIVTFGLTLAVRDRVNGFDDDLYYDVLKKIHPSERLDDFETEEGDDDNSVYVRAAAETAAHPYTALLAMFYAQFFDRESQGWSDWKGMYDRRDYAIDEIASLDALYDLLAALGYEASDEEKALRDGTSELYLKEEE